MSLTKVQSVVSLLVLAPVVLLASFYICPTLHGNASREEAQGVAVYVSKDTKVTARIENRSLGDAIRLMSEKKLFDIRGPLPLGEVITVRFSDLSVEEALKRLMRGYNYVLMDQGTSRRPLLMVLGKIERSKYTAEPAITPQSPSQSSPQAAAGQQPDPKTYYVPPVTIDQSAGAAPRPRPSGVRGDRVIGVPRPVTPEQRTPPQETSKQAQKDAEELEIGPLDDDADEEDNPVDPARRATPGASSRKAQPSNPAVR
jgi:hypothetical protein